MKRNYPYTSDDLRQIADEIDKVMADLPKEEANDIPSGHWLWGVQVEIRDDADYLAGVLKPYDDGWIGFYPKEVGE